MDAIRFDLSFLASADQRRKPAERMARLDPDAFSLVCDPTSFMEGATDRAETPSAGGSPYASLTNWLGFALLALQVLGAGLAIIDPLFAHVSSAAIGVGIIAERCRKPDIDMRRAFPKGPARKPRPASSMTTTTEPKWRLAQ